MKFRSFQSKKSHKVVQVFTHVDIVHFAESRFSVLWGAAEGSNPPFARAALSVAAVGGVLSTASFPRGLSNASVRRRVCRSAARPRRLLSSGSGVQTSLGKLDSIISNKSYKKHANGTVGCCLAADEDSVSGHRRPNMALHCAHDDAAQAVQLLHEQRLGYVLLHMPVLRGSSRSPARDPLRVGTTLISE